jgi:hypothetical protein
VKTVVVGLVYHDGRDVGSRIRIGDVVDRVLFFGGHVKDVHNAHPVVARIINNVLAGYDPVFGKKPARPFLVLVGVDGRILCDNGYYRRLGLADDLLGS